LSIKTSTVQKGGFVSFLGRIYGPSTWYFEPNSIVDLPRALTKFAYTSKAGELPDAELITLKSQSLLSLDALFPPVAKLCTLLLSNSKTVDLSNPKYRLHISYHLRRVIESGGRVVAHQFSDTDDWVTAYMAYSGNFDWYQALTTSLDNSKSYEQFVENFRKSYTPTGHETSNVYTDTGPLPSPPPREPIVAKNNTPAKPPRPKGPSPKNGERGKIIPPEESKPTTSTARKPNGPILKSRLPRKTVDSKTTSGREAATLETTPAIVDPP
jgi:hypothetical protein